jgi:hypothetical protein
VLSGDWMEVIVVVVEDAGQRHKFARGEREGYKWEAWTEEFPWRDHQDEILKQLEYAEKVWDVSILHGKRVGGKWRDFLVGRFMAPYDPPPGEASRLRFAQSEGRTVTDVTRDTIVGILESAKEQRLSPHVPPTMLVYTDPGPQWLKFDRKRGLAIIDEVTGFTWPLEEHPELPCDVSFIFAPPRDVGTTAHELGHVAGFADNGIRGNIMAPPYPGVSRTTSEEQKVKFRKTRFMNHGKRPVQGFKL